MVVHSSNPRLAWTKTLSQKTESLPFHHERTCLLALKQNKPSPDKPSQTKLLQMSVASITQSGIFVLNVLGY